MYFLLDMTIPPDVVLRSLLLHPVKLIAIRIRTVNNTEYILIAYNSLVVTLRKAGYADIIKNRESEKAFINNTLIW